MKVSDVTGAGVDKALAPVEVPGYATGFNAHGIYLLVD